MLLSLHWVGLFDVVLGASTFYIGSFVGYVNEETKKNPAISRGTFYSRHVRAGEHLRLSDYSLMLQGLAFQISSAYCLMVRSELNLPMRATLRIAFSAHAFLFWYSFATLACMST